MSEKNLTELTPEELEKAIKAGDVINDDRPIDDDFVNKDLEAGNEGE